MTTIYFTLDQTL